jgi:hypothetical protein
MINHISNKTKLLWLASVLSALVLGFIGGIYAANTPIDSGSNCDATNCGLKP